MAARAVHRHLGIAPRKVRLVVDLVRGKQVEQALAMLAFTRKAAALPLAKLIRSAVANAQEVHGMDPDRLIVKRIWVDEGPSQQRFLPRAQGRASPLLKRSSHISVELTEH